MKNYNLSFMNEYIKLKKISIYDLVGIFYVDAYKIKNYFNGLEVPPKSFLSMLYKYMEVNNYDELYNKVKNEIEKIKDENKVTSGFDKKFNIGFLSNKNIDIDDLSIYCNISKEEFTNYITGKKLTPIIIINKICEYFKVNNINDLKKLEEKEKNEINTFHDKRRIVNEFSFKGTKDEDNIEIIEKSLDIKNYDELKTVDNFIDLEEFVSYLKLYIKNKNITLKDISDGINVNYSYISCMLNGVYTLNEKYIIKILEFLNLENYDELKKIVNNSVDPEEFISYLKLYIKNKNITLKDISDGINMSYSHFSSILNGRRTLTEKYINKILEYLDIYNLNKLKYEKEEDLTFIKPFLILNGITQNEFAKILNCGITNANKALNGVVKLKPMYIKNLLEYFNFTDFKSFKDYVFLILNKNNVNIVDCAAISLIFTHNDVNKMMDKLSKELNISYDLLKYKYEKYKLMYIQSINSKNNDFNIPLYKLNH